MAKDKTPLEELLEINNPTEWKDFIMQLITTLLDKGHFESFTKDGREDFSAKIQGLYNYFARLEHT